MCVLVCNGVMATLTNRCSNNSNEVEQYFHLVLFAVICKVVLTFKSVDETLLCDLQ